MSECISLEMFGISSDGKCATCRISILSPEKHGEDYVCNATIGGLDETMTFPGYGVDPIQSLIMAIACVFSSVKQYEDDGWQFFLSDDRNENTRYSSCVWRDTFRGLF